MFRRNFDKHGWLRVIEAFIGIIMILGIVLIIMLRPASKDLTVQQETIKLEKFILDKVTADPTLRSQVLASDVSGVYGVLKESVPVGISYVARVCNYDEICALGMVVPYDVYTQEALVSSNLTYYEPKKVKMIRLFFWNGPWPKDACPSFCSEGETRLGCISDLSSVANYTCIRNSSACYYESPVVFENCSASGRVCDETSSSCKSI